MNANDYGVVFAFLTAYDMSANTSMEIQFWAPGVALTNPPTLTASSPDVTVPNVDFNTGSQIFPANLYALYTFKQGDITVAGQWSARVVYKNSVPTPPISLNSNVGTFQVGS